MDLRPHPQDHLKPPPPRNSLCTVFCWENQHLHKEFGRLSPLLDPPARVPPKFFMQIFLVFFPFVILRKLPRTFYEVFLRTSKNPSFREEKATQTKLSGLDIFGWDRVFHVKGWGPKDRYVLRSPGKPNFLAGYPGFCRISGGARKFYEKKSCIQFSSPILRSMLSHDPCVFTRGSFRKGVQVPTGVPSLLI